MEFDDTRLSHPNVVTVHEVGAHAELVAADHGSVMLWRGLMACTDPR